MFGEQHSTTLSLAPSSPAAGGHADPEAMLACAEAAAAWARYMQHVVPRHQQVAPTQPPSVVAGAPSRVSDAPRSKRAPASAAGGSSLWTIVFCLVVGAGCGFCCRGELQQLQQQPPQRQASAE